MRFRDHGLKDTNLLLFYCASRLDQIHREAVLVSPLSVPSATTECIKTTLQSLTHLLSLNSLLWNSISLHWGAL